MKKIIIFGDLPIAMISLKKLEITFEFLNENAACLLGVKGNQKTPRAEI